MENEQAREPVSEAMQDNDVFAEVPVFYEATTGSSETGDCSCFTCDGQPCFKA